MAACESVWIHDPEALRGNWRSLMPGCRELRVEVGCGKGKFTVETAEREPDVRRDVRRRHRRHPTR